MLAKQKLDEKKSKYNMPDSLYQKELAEIKTGNLDGEKVLKLTTIIKPLDTASYKNMIDALDEMQICSIGTYVIDKISEDDQKMHNMKGVK